jgi:hypothetical protein
MPAQIPAYTNIPIGHLGTATRPSRKLAASIEKNDATKTAIRGVSAVGPYSLERIDAYRAPKTAAKL